MRRGTPVIEATPHPRLRFRAFETTFPAPLGALGSPAWLVDLLSPGAVAPVQREEALRSAVRDMLRHSGYKPTGRGKPASEYLVRAAEEGTLVSINAAVDACNAVSLHSGFPISVIDLDRASPPFAIRAGAAGEAYVFNASGQSIDVAGLLCLCDAPGPCANAVKDAERTKTGPATRRTLSVVWGAAGFEDRLDAAVSWYRELLDRLGAVTGPV
jgi:DNA/RNA-binding domain of Phe-tRNA-synthetase-like protein